MQVKTRAPGTPCIRNCCLDDNNICLGCCRSLDEILQWQDASEERRQEWLKRAEQRRQGRVNKTR